MNTLSMMIYAAEVLGNVQIVLGISSVLSAAVIGIYIMVTAFNAEYDKNLVGMWKKGLGYVWIPVVLAIFAALMPSSSTVYLMASSEVGEQIVTSPENQEIFSDLKKVIKKKLADELVEGSSK